MLRIEPGHQPENVQGLQKPKFAVTMKPKQVHLVGDEILSHKQLGIKARVVGTSWFGPGYDRKVLLAFETPPEPFAFAGIDKHPLVIPKMWLTEKQCRELFDVL